MFRGIKWFEDQNLFEEGGLLLRAAFCQEDICPRRPIIMA